MLGHKNTCHTFEKSNKSLKDTKKSKNIKKFFQKDMQMSQNYIKYQIILLNVTNFK